MSEIQLDVWKENSVRLSIIFIQYVILEEEKWLTTESEYPWLSQK